MSHSTWLLVVALGALTVSIVLQAILIARDPTPATHDTARLANATSCPPTGGAATIAAAPQACSLPETMRAATYARTWFVLGDEFAAGQGASVSYLSLLQAQARTLTNANPVVVNAVGDANAQSLPDQVDLVRRTTAYRSLLASTQPALVVVSYGAGLLQRQADRGAQDAALSIVMEHLAALTSPGNTSLIPPDRTSQFYVLLLSHPDPTHGGVAVPAECATCPSLNHPTLASRTAHREIYASLRLVYAGLAARHGWAWLDTDVALGSYAWPGAPNCAASAFADCYLYNDLGQSLLASETWKCLSGE